MTLDRILVALALFVVALIVIGVAVLIRSEQRRERDA